MEKLKFKTNDRVKIIKPVDTALWATGLTGRICKMDSSDIPYLVELDDPNHPRANLSHKVWCAEVELLEPRSVHPVIVITTDGKTVTAIKKQGKKILKKAEARCNDSDDFHFEVGATLALARLAGAKIIKVDAPKPQYYNGKVVCIKTRHPWWTVGKVYDVIDGRITADDGCVYPTYGKEPYRDAEYVRHAGCMSTIGLPRHNPDNTFIPYVE